MDTQIALRNSARRLMPISSPRGTRFASCCCFESIAPHNRRMPSRICFVFAAVLFPLYRSVKVTHLDFERCVQRAQRRKRPRAQRSNFINQSKTKMSYISDFETELTKKLIGNETADSVVRWVSEKVLESYRNGITAGQKGAQVIRKGQSRRRSFPAQAL